VRFPVVMKDIAAVVAASATSRGIGCAGNLPWRLPEDMRYFREITSTPPSPGLVNAVIMGRTTWESIPPKFRPLPSRTNVILTRGPPTAIQLPPKQQNPDSSSSSTTLIASSLHDAIEQLNSLPNVGNIFVIGGGQLYKEAMDLDLITKIYYTQVKNIATDIENQMDVFFPKLDESIWKNTMPLVAHCDNDDKTSLTEDNTDQMGWKIDEKSQLMFRFLQYSRTNNGESSQSDKPEGLHVNEEEMQYLQHCNDIIQNGTKKGDRTGTGTLSKFGIQMRYSLRDNTLPLLTTKRTFWRGVAEELLWFISGNTNANVLAEKDIHIWDGNGSREFLNQRGLSHREVGDLGPVYGFQWRHFGAEYIDMHTDYTGKGVDQLADCIDKIKNNPEDRRIIMSAWNPADLQLMALPPCHMFCQFYVDTEKNELSCQMYQRSADMGLGVPFNIASYALLTHMIAHVCNMKAGDFVHTIGDAHVYLNHVDALKEQLTRSPRAFPKLKIKSEKKDIDGFVFEDFEVLGYKPHKSIKMKMAV